VGIIHFPLVLSDINRAIRERLLIDALDIEERSIQQFAVDLAITEFLRNGSSSNRILSFIRVSCKLSNLLDITFRVLVT
jgi:hypothetical protein